MRTKHKIVETVVAVGGSMGELIETIESGDNTVMAIVEVTLTATLIMEQGWSFEPNIDGMEAHRDILRALQEYVADLDAAIKTGISPFVQVIGGSDGLGQSD